MVFLKSEVKSSPNAVSGILPERLPGGYFGVIIAQLSVQMLVKGVAKRQVDVERVFGEARSDHTSVLGLGIIVVPVIQRHRRVDPACDVM